jgi:7-cyano-7-deazaguanine synthase
MRKSLGQPDIGLLLSGGVDSVVLLDQLVNGGRQVVPFYVQTDCVWQAAELNSVERFLSAVTRPELADLIVLEMPLADLYGDHWSVSGIDVPSNISPDQAVFLPGHNPLMLLKPAIWCSMHGVQELAIATLANNPFSDATPGFFARFEGMLHEAMGRRVEITRPFGQLSKDQVLEMGRHLPLGLTFSCLAPIGGMHCGQCNKCGERRRAFMEIGIDDPTEYAVAVPLHGVTHRI